MWLKFSRCGSGRDELKHCEFASALHRGAAASVFDQLELDGGSMANQAKNKHPQVPGPGGKQSALTCGENEYGYAP